MAILNVNPTRMEQKRLSERLQVATRGHTLLKEKQDSLIRKFMSLIDQAKNKRRGVEDRMGKLFVSYQEASIISDDQVLQQSLNATEQRMEVAIKLTSILGIKVPKMSLVEKAATEEAQSYFLTPGELDIIQEMSKEVSQEVIELAAIEKQCFLLGEEIIATRRRVNSLEFKTIPDLEETIHYIKMKIEDTERSQIAKMIKLK
ncbi:V-type ATP synthase subunit D [Vagococcus sp. BWB3-3]|uniref:V-type ATP synthase subunit D n=1 Tax=Vagococcus allomyrinae TaxID=2794353 RepID=A0A940SUH3_9ENTE|nr:V-type ATP synthase subunit D [Vagococcus allomyrinae]MBP1040061.1 V-type ATP synthase subunit D [Vagococcus allomyrinae]